MGLSEDDAAFFTRFLFETPTLLCRFQLDGVLTWVSPQWSELLDYPTDVIEGAPSLDFLHPDDLEPTKAVLDRIEAGETVKNFTNRYRRRNGGWLWLSWWAQLRNGEVYGIATDVSAFEEERLKAERGLRLLRVAEDLAKVGHWRIDFRDDSVEWSPQVYRIHGLDPDTYEVTRSTAIDCAHPDDRERVASEFRAALTATEPFAIELRIVYADGSIRHVVTRGSPERDSRGELVGAGGVFQDVTEQRAVMQALQETEHLRAVGTLAAGVAHEINNPLQYISTGVDLALEGLASVNRASWVRRQRELLEDARYGVDQVGRIVKDLRSLTTPVERDRAQPVDLSEVLDTTVNMTRSRLRRHAELVESYSRVPLVDGRQRELVQLFINLLTNALDAVEGQERAVIRVSAFTRDDGWAIVDVDDNGPGIHEEVRGRIFEPFFSTKSLGKGTGLGLYVCRNIVQRHGGELKLEVVAGKTRFRTALPPGKLSHSSPTPNQVGPSVLIVDDDSRVGRAMQRTLERDYLVELVSDPVEALQRLLERDYEILVCDLMMPGLSGVELLEQLLPIRPEFRSRTIFVSGTSQTLVGEMADIALLAKPFSPEALRAAVERRLSEG